LLAENIDNIRDFSKINLNKKEKPEKSNRTPKIFCMILTSQKNLKSRVKLVYDKWAHKCSMHKFITVIPNEMLPDSQVHSDGAIEYHNGYHILQPPKLNSTTDKYDKLTDKSFLTMQYISKTYQEFDWFIKADDDTYILVDNLREFLSTKNASQPVTYGYDFKVIVDYGYHSGGGSYVLSREAITRLQLKLDADYKSCQNTGTEDVDVARCLRGLGVFPNKSIDEQGRERFHPLDLLGHYYGNFPDWLYSYASNPVQKVKSIFRQQLNQIKFILFV
jgi:glycoprotein-N-acetylgalactosamine 3-beta-galactosyltransferase